MTDDFAGLNQALDGPAVNALAITPNASPLAHATRGLYIGVAGDITVTMLGGGSVTFPNVPVGVLPIRITALTAAVATGIVALW